MYSFNNANTTLKLILIFRLSNSGYFLKYYLHKTKLVKLNFFLEGKLFQTLEYMFTCHDDFSIKCLWLQKTL